MSKYGRGLPNLVSPWQATGANTVADAQLLTAAGSLGMDCLPGLRDYCHDTSEEGVDSCNPF